MLLRLPGASGRARYERTGVRPTFTNLRGREGVKGCVDGFKQRRGNAQDEIMLSLRVRREGSALTLTLLTAG